MSGNESNDKTLTEMTQIYGFVPKYGMDMSTYVSAPLRVIFKSTRPQILLQSRMAKIRQIQRVMEYSITLGPLWSHKCMLILEVSFYSRSASI